MHRYPARQKYVELRLTPLAVQGDRHGFSTPGPVIEIGPGGGARLEHGVCITTLGLFDLVFAQLDPKDEVIASLRGPLGLGRALLALARHAEDPRVGEPNAMFTELCKLDGDVFVEELQHRLEAVRLPSWVPPAAIARVGATLTGIPRLPHPTGQGTQGISQALLEARILAGMRGSVFHRSAALSLTRVLDTTSCDDAMRHIELWLPVRPGTGGVFGPGASQPQGGVT
jgi:hypothetical protein